MNSNTNNKNNYNPRSLKDLANAAFYPYLFTTDIPCNYKVFYEQICDFPLDFLIAFEEQERRMEVMYATFRLKPITTEEPDIRRLVTHLLELIDDVDELLFDGCDDNDKVHIIDIPHNFFQIIMRCFYFGTDFTTLSKMLLQLSGDVESNPGPINFIERFNNLIREDCKRKIIREQQMLDDGVPYWIISIELPDLNIVSQKSLALTKKSAMQFCYEDLLNKISKIESFNAKHESEGAEGVETADYDKSLHTNLAVTTEPSEGVPTVIAVERETVATTEAVGDYGNLTKQWYLIDDFQWNPTDTGILREYTLPRMILANNVACQSPPLIPFNINYAMRGDIELRIETKAQVFLTGMLQIGSYYEFTADANAKFRRNPYSISQTNHVVVNAGGSNEAILHIPYVNRQQYLQTKIDNPGANDDSVLNMCNVIINVLNPLQVGTGSSSVSVAIFVRFLNTKFQGKRDGSLGLFPNPTSDSTGDRVKHESGLVEVGANMALDYVTKMLNQRNADRNRDNPPDIRPSNMLIPYAAQSWSVGTAIAEPIRTLRLDPRGQTNHYTGLPEYTSMSHIADTFGLIKQVNWSESQDVGTTIFQIPCSPILTSNYYDPINVDGLTSYAVPPVGVVASMFNLFRGPLKFKLQIVANKFYTGGLIMGYIPGVGDQFTINNNIARNSGFSTYALSHDNLTITYETPYINLAEWLTTPLKKPINNSVSRVPGIFYINVLQKLQKPDNVASQITINVYMSAGDNFECANLTQPGLVLPYEATIIPNVNLIATPYESSSSLYFGTALEFFGGNSLLARYGTLFAEYSTYTINLPGTAFLCETPEPVQVTGAGAFKTQLFVALQVGTRFIMVPYPSSSQLPVKELAFNYQDTDEKRDEFIPHIYSNADEGPFLDPIPQFVVTWQQSEGLGASVEIGINPPIITPTKDINIPVITPVSSNNIVRHESERNNNPNSVSSVQSFPSSSWGMTCFGENFNDIKDLLRRPVRLRDCIYTDTPSVAFPRADFEFKVKPTTSSLDLSDVFDIYNRNDHSKIILSGFRYYRGGMRYRIVAPALPGAHIWVQYDASSKIASDFIQYPAATVPTPIIQHSNPIDILSLNVNQILQIEIPWYQPNELNLLQEVDYSKIDNDTKIGADMGTVRVGFSTNASSPISGSYTINVYQKVADDFSPFVFQGFTGFNFLHDLNDVDVPFIAKHESVGKYLTDKIVEPIKGEVRQEVSGVVNQVKEAVEMILGNIKDTSIKMLDFNKNSLLIDLISELGHCLINPDIKTFAWAVVSLLAKIGIVSVNAIVTGVDLFVNMAKSILPFLSNQQEQDNNGSNFQANHEGDKEDSSWWSLILSSVFQLFQLTQVPTLNAAYISKNFMKHVREYTQTSNSLTSFFLIQMDNIKEILRHCCFWKNFYNSDNKSIQVYNSEFITNWCKEVNILTAPGQETKILVDNDLMERVYVAYLIGQLITVNIIDRTKNVDINHNVLMEYIGRIKRLQEHCVSMGKHSNVRYETFTMWCYGASGIGKSYITEELTTELLIAGDIQFRGCKTLTLNPTSKYWDRCDDQPILLVDDFLAVTTEEALNNQLSILFNVFTPVPLNPTMADISDKKKIYSPRICVINSNYDYPAPNGIGCPEALWRRRHCLIKIELDRDVVPEDIKGVEDPRFNMDWCENNNHLKFSLAKDPRSRIKGYNEPMKYEQFMEVLIQRFKEFNIRELRNYKHRLSKYYKANRQEFNENLVDIQSKSNIPSMDEGNFDVIVEKLLEKSDNQHYLDSEPKDAISFIKQYCKNNKVTGRLMPVFRKYYTKAQTALKYNGGISIIGMTDPPVKHEGDFIPATINPHFLHFPESAIELQLYYLKIQEWINDRALLLVDNKIDVVHFKSSIKNIFQKELNNGTDLCHEYDEVLFDVNSALYFWLMNNFPEMVCSHYSLCTMCYYDKQENNIYCEHVSEYTEVKICSSLCAFSSPFAEIYRTVLEDNPSNESIPKIWDRPYFTLPILGNIETCVRQAVDSSSSNWQILKVFLFDHWKLLTAAVATCGFILYLYLRNRNNCIKATPEGQNYDKFKIATKNKKALKAVKLAQKAPEMKDAGIQHESESQNFETLKRLVTRNTYVIQIVKTTDGQEHRRTYRVLALGDREFLIVSHFITEINYWCNDGYEIFIRCGTRACHPAIKCGEDFVNAFRNQVKLLRTSAAQSLSVMTFPSNVPQSPSIIKHFQTEACAQRMDIEGCMIKEIIGETNDITTELKMVDYTISPRPVQIVEDEVNNAQLLEDSYMYKGFNGAGNCGSVLCNVKTGKIVGIHVAGTTGTGFACPVFQESFVDLNIKEIIMPQLEKLELNDKIIESSIFPIGRVSKQYAKNESGKSKIVKSAIYGSFPVLTEPSPLSPYDPRLPEGSSPLYDGCAKHGKPPIDMPDVLLEPAMKDFQLKVIAKCIPKRLPIRELTEKESIIGIPELDFNGIPMNTSEGFPLSSMRPHGCKGKGWLTNIKDADTWENKTYDLNPAIKKILFVKNELRKKGIKPFTLFTDCLKDETLLKEKCRIQGKTRIFSISPYDFTIQCRQLFGDYLIAHQASRFNIEHAIGINIWSYEWTDLALRLQKYGMNDNIVAGDFSNFGPGAMSKIALICLDIIINWYVYYYCKQERVNDKTELSDEAKEHLTKMDVMKQELVNSPHLCFTLVYMTPCGIISGSPLTTPLNSMINSIEIRTAWLSITKTSMYEFENNVELITYGDDNIMCVSDEYIGEFNVKSLQQFFAKYNIKYTSVDKTDNIIPYCKLSETSFLKCQFIPNLEFRKGHYLPGVDKVSVTGQMNWVNSEGDNVENTLVNCESALRSAFGHGRDYYDSLYNKIERAWLDLGHHFIYKNYDELNHDLGKTYLG